MVLVRGCVSSSSAVPGEKKVGPSSSCTGSISPMLSRDVLSAGRDGLLPLTRAGGVSSTSLSSGEPVSAMLKLKPAKPIAAWNAPMSDTGEYGASSSSSGMRSCWPDGEVTNAIGDMGALRDWFRWAGGLRDTSPIGAYRLAAMLSRPPRNRALPRSLSVRACDGVPPPIDASVLPLLVRFWRGMALLADWWQRCAGSSGAIESARSA